MRETASPTTRRCQITQSRRSSLAVPAPVQHSMSVFRRYAPNPGAKRNQHKVLPLATNAGLQQCACYQYTCVPSWVCVPLPAHQHLVLLGTTPGSDAEHNCGRCNNEAILFGHNTAKTVRTLIESATSNECVYISCTVGSSSRAKTTSSSSKDISTKFCKTSKVHIIGGTLV
jgi:hypothetical protein